MRCKKVNTKSLHAGTCNTAIKSQRKKQKCIQDRQKLLCTGAEVNCRVKTKHSGDTATTGCGASAVFHVPVSQVCLFHHIFLLQKLPAGYCMTLSIPNHS